MNVHEDHLKNQAMGLSVADLMSLIQRDQVNQWKGEQPLKVEDYLRLFPALQEDVENVLVLIMSEIIQREALGQGIDDKEYFQRFPDLREQLKIQLEFHQAMGQPTVTIQGTGSLGTSTASSSLAGKLIADKYVLRECIGEGGMGTVWRAEQLAPVKRQVAIKLIKTGLDTRTVMARFEAERQALAIMDHPNIAKVLDGGVTPENEPYFVMELVKGVSLTQYCDHNKLSIRQRLELFLPVCSAIQHAHQKGIIHRDIKPSNVLVALYDLKPVPKVIDFGVAKAIHAPLTDVTLETGIGNVLGTPEYMSPEQASLNNLDIDTRTDVYSLGVLLYELLTGNPPFSSEEFRQKGLLELLRVIRDEEPPRPSDRLSSSKLLATISVNRNADSKKLVGSLRNDLDLIVMKAMEKERSRRYDSAGSLADDLQRYLAGEPVHAHPPSAVYRFCKFVDKNRTLVGISLVVLLAIMTAITGIFIGYFHAQEQRDIAQNARDNEAAQLKIAQAEMKKAQQAEEQTLNAYRATTDLTIQELIGSKEEMGIKEKAYLEKSLELWKKFADREGDDQLRMNLRAEGHFRVGMIWGKMGNHADAIKEYVQAIELRKKLANENPEQRDYQRNLALAHYSLCYQLRDQSKWLAALEQAKFASAIQEQLVEKDRNDLIYPLELSRTHDIIGLILTTLGRDQEAQTEYEAALRLQLKLVEHSPDTIRYSWTLASTYKKLGNLSMRRKKPESALSQFQSSHLLLEKVVKQFPDDSEANADLADIHTGFARVYLSLGQYIKSQEANLAAIAIHEKLVELYPLKHKNHLSLANTYTVYASLLQRLGKYDEALIQLQSARAIQKTLTNRYPQNTYYQIKLASNDASQGGLAYESGKYPESIKLYSQAIEVLSPLHLKSLNEPVAREYLSQVYAARAISSSRLMQFNESIKDWDQAIKVGLPRQVPVYRAGRAHAYVQVGRIDEAIAEATKLSSTPGLDGATKWTDRQWFDLACVYAAAYGAGGMKNESYAERSIYMLKKSVEAGYRQLNDFRIEKVLDSLRDRKDFKQITESMPNQMGSTK